MFNFQWTFSPFLYSILVLSMRLTLFFLGQELIYLNFYFHSGLAFVLKLSSDLKLSLFKFFLKRISCNDVSYDLFF